LLEEVQTFEKEEKNNILPEEQEKEIKNEEMQKIIDKHPLQFSWTLWYKKGTNSRDKRNTTEKKNWEDEIKKIYSFDTIEDFWSLFNNIASPSQLMCGSDYFLFKSDIEPKWEDPQNKNGGNWTILVQNSPSRKELLDHYWLSLVLSCIGGYLNGIEEVCGIVVGIRNNQDKLSIWTRTHDNSNINKDIG